MVLSLAVIGILVMTTGLLSVIATNYRVIVIARLAADVLFPWFVLLTIVKIMGGTLVVTL